MPAITLLGSISRLARLQPYGALDDIRHLLRQAPDNTLGLALQASLRSQVEAWVHQANPRRLKRQLKQSKALLEEVERRLADEDAVEGAMLALPACDVSPTDALMQATRVKAMLVEVMDKVTTWAQLPFDVSRQKAAWLASELQDLTAELLEYAGRADASDPRQVDWMRLVEHPHLLDIESDSHASAIIGATCWHLAGEGRLRAWQLLAWRMWSMDANDLAMVTAKPNRWVVRLRGGTPVRPMKEVLLKAGVLTHRVDGHLVRRPRKNAVLSGLAILQALRYDAEDAAERDLRLPG